MILWQELVQSHFFSVWNLLTNFFKKDINGFIFSTGGDKFFTSLPAFCLTKIHLSMFKAILNCIAYQKGKFLEGVFGDFIKSISIIMCNINYPQNLSGPVVKRFSQYGSWLGFKEFMINTFVMKS